MPALHHSAICVRNLDESLRFWRDGIGLTILMDREFTGDWPTLLHAPGTWLRAVFLGDPLRPDTGIVELVDLAAPCGEPRPDAPAQTGFLLLSLMCDVEATLGRLALLGLGGSPRRITQMGVEMAVVSDPDGVLVELVADRALRNLG